MFYLLPPAGTSISLKNMLDIVYQLIKLKSYKRAFTERIVALSEAEHCLLLNHGRSALYMILKSLSAISDPGKNEVIMPAYTCYSVAAAVAKANLKINLIDIDPTTLDYDYDLLKNADMSRVLAIIGCNLFGIMNDWTRLRSIASQCKAYLIDDAAQSMGSVLDDRVSGIQGDVGFFSMGRGKNLSAYSGGILVTNNGEIANQLALMASSLDKPNLIGECGDLIKLFLMGFLQKPRLYWFPAMLPFLGLGKTEYDDEYYVGLMSSVQECAGYVLIDNLAGINDIRKKNAEAIAKGLLKNDRISIPGYTAGNCPIYVRLPVLVQDRIARDRAVSALRRKGISASPMYPSIISHIHGINGHLTTTDRDFPEAQLIVERLLSIPTHPYVRNRDIQCIIGHFSEE